MKDRHVRADRYNTRDRPHRDDSHNINQKHHRVYKARKTIAIIGAGPAGSYAAELLAKKGFDVHLFEEHAKIGEPVQCTGIVTNSITDIISLNKEAVVNNISTIRIHAPDNNYIDFKFGRKNIILDRAKFDK